MCGFAGIVQLDGAHASPDRVRGMTRLLEHRGPDDEGYHVDGPVALGFRRLAIVDLSPLGHQPMASDDERFVIVFNGEIYNHVELRTQLRGLGHRFRSGTDTEVLLAAYQQWGTDCLARLNGMWAFLIHDRVRGTVFGSRDRFGQKPLYRARHATALLFASEIKALRASGLVPSTPDWSMVSQLLAYGRMEYVRPDGRTFFQGVEEVAPATAFEVSPDGRSREWTYWTPAMQPGAAAAYGAAERAADAEEFRAVLDDAVRIHSRADVRVGVTLSGGLDSSAITCLLARQRGHGAEPLRAFSYMTPDFDERTQIGDVVAQSGAVLTATDTTPQDAFDALSTVLWYQDEPVQSMSAVIGHEIYGMAARADTKVVLGGQGADELLGGYASNFPIYWASLLSQGRVATARAEIAAYAKVHGGDPAAMLRQAARARVSNGLSGLPGIRHLRRERDRRRAAGTAREWCAPELLDGLAPAHDARGMTSVAAELERNITSTPLPLYLRVEDRNSMARSVEARLPFLDARLAAFAARMPDAARLRGPWNKAILRDATAGAIPDSVRLRAEKFGFPSPTSSWLRTALYDRVHDLITSAAARERGIYDVPALVRRLERHRAGSLDSTDLLFSVAQLELWFREVVPASAVDPAPVFVPAVTVRGPNLTRVAQAAAGVAGLVHFR
jgi:asparagine synthase (glutamine-hydrolysing)